MPLSKIKTNSVADEVFETGIILFKTDLWLLANAEVALAYT